MIKFANVEQGIISASRTMLANDGLDEGQIDSYMALHQAPLIVAGNEVLNGSKHVLEVLEDMRQAIRSYIDANPA